VDALVRLTRARGAAWLLLLVSGGCSTLTPPLVQSQLLETAPQDLLRKVAVVPFQPDPHLRTGEGPGAISAAVAADLVTRFVAEALSARHVAIVAPNDLVVAFEGQGMVLPRTDAATLAGVAASQFGATAILVGTVSRYREREGGARGALRPASVAFAFTVYAAPGAAPAFRARFDQTQVPISANVFSALRYPGNGTRWLTAAELARWGAGLAVAEIPGGLE
jgi:hypothetical protein